MIDLLLRLIRAILGRSESDQPVPGDAPAPDGDERPDAPPVLSLSAPSILSHPDPPPPLTPEEMMPDPYRLMADSLAIALTQDGVREVPPNSNRGPEVEKYLAAVGLKNDPVKPGETAKPGHAWCAAFTSWCCHQAGGRAGIDYPHTAWAPAMWSWAQGRGRAYWVHPDDVAAGTRSVPPGALFLLYGRVGEVERVNHVGFVESAAAGMVWTVEGNTNPAGSRDGGGVYRRERAVRTIYRFVLYGDL